MVNTDRVEYSLFHKDFGTQIITEPEGWKDDEKEYARVDEYDGIFVLFSNNLTFVKDGAGFLAMIYNMYGINEDVILRKRERHPHTNVWMNTYMGYLDFSTYEFQNNKVTIKFDSGGIEQLLKTRMKDDFEIERLDTIEGRPLPELPVETIVLNGRRIFLDTQFDVLEISNTAKTQVESNAGNTRRQTVGIPLNLVIDSHENAHSVLPQSTGTENEGTTGMMFFAVNNIERYLAIKLDYNFNARFQQYEHVQWCRYKVCLTTYENGINYDLKERRVLTHLSSRPSGTVVLPDEVDFPVPQFTKPVSGEWTGDITLLEGESLALEILLESDMYVSNTAGVRVYAENIVANLTIKENSYFPPTTTKAVLAHELGQRLTQIITNRDDAFFSEALGRTDIGYIEDGVNTGALNGFANGMWIRGFDKEPQDDENRYKPFTTSFQDYIENLKATWNLALGIEKFSYKERIRIEKKSFFYNQNVTIHVGYQESGKWVYPKVKNLKRMPSSDHYYSDITVGFEKGWENEEAQGLDEYNTQTTFTTPITRISNKFEAISNYIFASYAKEFIRRKPKLNYPTTDHKNDKEIFGMDLKRDPINGYTERLWQDDFETEPTGVFSPETATNLRLTPINTLLRHARNIMAGLTKLSTQMIRYASSEGNSNLTTQQIGQQAYTENNDILISDMERPYYVAEYVEFEYPVNFELLQQVEGYTEILGKRVPNFYGLVRFRNENNDLETGFLINLKPNNQGQWKLLKHNR